MKCLKKLWRKHKLLIIIPFLVLAALLIFFGAKLFLYAYLLLGNDIIVKVEADKEDLFLVRGEEGVVKLKASVTTNPFCTARCEYSFRDLSRDLYVDKDVSVLRPGIPLEKEYNLKVLRLGSGQDLYRFEMSCRSVNTWLCHTEEGMMTTRSILISVNYDLSDEEREQKLIVKSELEILTARLETVLGEKAWLDEPLSSLNKTLTVENLETGSNNVDVMASKVRQELLSFKELFKQDKHSLLFDSLPGLEGDVVETESAVEDLKMNTDNLLASYNSFVDELANVRGKLNGLRDSMPEDEGFITSLNQTVNDFNKAVKIINEKNSLEEKEEALNITSESVNHLSLSLQELTSLPLSNITITSLEETYLGRIELAETYSPINLGIFFEDSQPQCCLFRDCNPCCTSEECNNDAETYPVMLVHGHAVSEGVSAEYSLEGFTKIQEKLEEDGYLNSGIITLYSPQAVVPGLWGLSGKPVVVRSSYYFDVFKEAPENYRVVQTKSESIDTYAIRLKELVDVIKYRTGKPKVNIIAFSMGGLVARRYVQVFGDQDVNKLILVGTPNSGVVGEVARVCPLIGAELECRDLTEGSLFLNKLNRASKPSIPVYTIVGTGCDMGEGKGDGTVLEDHATISWAENHIIQGVCTGKFEPLHLDLLKPELYPEAYKTIVKILKED
ncbi:MAG: alpha/beta fold hydrolase [Nanoarchaeota archaeon]|nr:alpha/beta fold hydrolase [Nanoarchaeota archaeon]